MMLESQDEINFDLFPPQVKAVGKDRVAIVLDNNQIIRQNHALILKKMSFDVRETAIPETVFELLKKFGPNFCSLLVTELSLPGVTGAEVIAKIHNLYPDAAIKIVVCSHISNIKIIRQIAELGVSDYIVKPVDYKSFVEKIQKLFIADPAAKKE